MLQSQKKRTSSKKSKVSKTQIPIQLPLTPLLQQINQLKTQLASIKSKKNIKIINNEASSKVFNQMPTQILSPKINNKGENKLKMKGNQQEGRLQIKIKDIVFPIRENQLKLNIQLVKLNQLIQSNNLTSTISHLNKFITYLNDSICKLRQNFPINYQTSQPSLISNSRNISHLQSSHWKQQIRLYQQCNKQLQKQNIQYKHIIAKLNDTIQQVQKANILLKQQYEQLAHMVKELEDQGEKLRILCDGLRDQREQLQEKLKIYQRTIQKKQSQIILYQQDLNFIRMQCEKLKIQKRQSEKLLQNLQKQFNQLKNKSQLQIQSLKKQKNIYKSQCQSNRYKQKQYLHKQQQKIKKNKQIQHLRQQNTLIKQQLNRTKQKLYEQENKIYKYQQQNYKINNQNQKYKRNVEYYKISIKQMGEQVQELRKQSQQYRDMILKNKIGGKYNEKQKVLGQIHQLIKMHKMYQQDQ